jgi:hypothetical protein
MGTLVNIVIADEDEAEAIGESNQPVDEWVGLEARDLDKSKFITLHCLLTGDGIEDAVYGYEPLYFVEDGPQVLRIPDEMTKRLARYDDEALEEVVQELAATEDFEQSDLAEEDIHAFMEEFAELARKADAEEKTLFIWMHPLLT